MAVRTRKAGSRWLQTVKCAAESVGGLSPPRVGTALRQRLLRLLGHRP
jgi:hypothetical protein